MCPLNKGDGRRAFQEMRPPNTAVPRKRSRRLPETPPAARRPAALIVDATRAGGADANADPDDNTTATDPLESTTPRFMSRYAVEALQSALQSVISLSSAESKA
jgi:hypothetical protein